MKQKLISSVMAFALILSLSATAFASSPDIETPNSLAEKEFVENLKSGNIPNLNGTLKNENGTEYKYNLTPVSYQCNGNEVKVYVEATTNDMELAKTGNREETCSEAATKGTSFPILGILDNKDSTDNSVRLCGSMDDTKWDPTTSVAFYMCLTYTTSSTSILLTRVNGSYTIEQSGASVLTNTVMYCCTNVPSLVIQKTDQTFTASSFLFNTGFTNYVVADNSTSQVGLVWNASIKRGSTTWTSTVNLYRYGGV
jgi:hypothetical protein